ncbi:MAG: nucleotidyltransferase family protein [Elusimicrobiota bacterium]
MKDWLTKNTKCVVLAAGRGKRMLEVGQEIPKVMVEVGGMPLLGWTIDYWSAFSRDFVFVVGYRKELITEYVAGLKGGLKDGLEGGAKIISYNFVEQKQPRGIAHAVECAREFIEDKFILVLGDCVCRGNFEPAPGCSGGRVMSQGFGVWETDNPRYIKQSYSVEIKDGLVAGVVEKPKGLVNNLCGMGFYFFNGKVFDYIKKTPPSALRGEVEITDVLQNMVSSGERLSPVFFKGEYLNVTSPEDIKTAERILKWTSDGLNF